MKFCFVQKKEKKSAPAKKSRSSSGVQAMDQQDDKPAAGKKMPEKPKKSRRFSLFGSAKQEEAVPVNQSPQTIKKMTKYTRRSSIMVTPKH